MEEILYPAPKQQYKVLVKTITYNQAKYIQDTLNGVAMQQTNFPFVEVVIDDCSTDGEQDIIKSWLTENCVMENAEYIEIPTSHIIMARHKTNSNCTFAIYLLKRNLWKEPEEKRKHFKPWEEKCEYIALCEGDDYWTDSLKLQKQVNYLDAHLDCSCCVHEYKEWLENKQSFRPHSIRYLRGFNGDGLSFDIREYAKSIFFTKTLTALFRTESFNNSNYHKYESQFDMTLFFALATQGKIYLMNDVMGVYRMNDGGVTSDYNRDSFYMRVIPGLFSICIIEKNKYAQEFVYNYIHEFIFYFIRKQRHLYINCLKYLGFKYNLLLHFYDLPKIISVILKSKLIK